MRFSLRFTVMLLASILVVFLLAHARAIPSPHNAAAARRFENDCTEKIKNSLSPSFSWTSDSALDLAHCLRWSTPLASTCVFYTRDSREDAIRFAAENRKTTIYDVYPPRYFNTSHAPAADWKRRGHLRDLFKVTSKAYAIACSGTATLVIPENEEPCPTSIWVTDEYDAIKNRLSRIELPIWKVSWGRNPFSGVWGWIQKQLKGASTGFSGRGEELGKREATPEPQPEPEPVPEPAPGLLEAWKQKYIAPTKQKVEEKVAKLREEWGGLKADAEDPWAIVGGACAR